MQKTISILVPSRWKRAAYLFAIGYLPVPVWHCMAYVSGMVHYAFNVRNSRGEIVPLIRRALKCGALKANLVACLSIIENVLCLYEMAYFLGASRSKVKNRFARDVSMAGAEHLRVALNEGRGVILFSAQFGLMYMSMFHRVGDPLIDRKKIYLLLKTDGVFDEVLERIRSLTDREVYIIDVDDPLAAKEILAALRENSIVACMFDSILDGTSLVISQFLGEYAGTPAGIPKIACHTGATVLPQFTFRNGTKYETKILSPLESTCNVAGMDECTVRAAEAMNSVIESEIRAAPGRWRFWNALEQRWAWGRLSEPE